MKILEKNKIYVVTPDPMLTWMQLFIDDSLVHSDAVVLVPSDQLNPEPVYYYQREVNGRPFRQSNYKDAEVR